ncbi:MAG TPA: hypothetical protein VLF62_01390 [Candidatus Saccharimonadales bacterium]|nr:hypothetical protein [Candidatus Saccharimonadales bacterium]
MDPYNNQPGVGRVPGQQPEPIVSQDAQGWPTRAQEVPDWQQGLGRPAPTVFTGDPYAMQLPNVDQENQFPQMPPAAQTQPPRPVPAPLTPQPAQPIDNSQDTYKTPEERQRRSLALFFTLGIIAILLIAAAAVYFIQKRNNTAAPAVTTQNSPAPAPKGGDLASLTGLDFGLPHDLGPYAGDISTAATYHIYLTQGSTDATGCSLEFGISTADELPGKDAATAINTQVEALKAAGAAVAGPTKGSTLQLKSGDGKTTYAVPTTNYQFSKDNKYVSVHYSLVVLKSGQRAVISRQCVNTGGAPDNGNLDKIESSAKQLTINPAKQ